MKLQSASMLLKSDITAITLCLQVAQKNKIPETTVEISKLFMSKTRKINVKKMENYDVKCIYHSNCPKKKEEKCHTRNSHKSPAIERKKNCRIWQTDNKSMFFKFMEGIFSVKYERKNITG